MAEEQDKPQTCARNSHWFSLAAFATIALVSITSETGKIKDQDKYVKWAVSAISVALSLAGLAVLARMMLKEKFVGTPMEGGLAVLSFGFMCAVLPSLMDPDNDFAVAELGGIENANLYFFSWGAFIMSFFVFLGYLRELRGMGGTVKDAIYNMNSWAALCMTSLIVMAAGSRFYKQYTCDQNTPLQGSTMCDRLKFVFSVGVISAVLSFFWALIGHKCPALVDGLLSCLMLVLWVLAITWTTFGDHAPAKEPSNLYFFTWGSFALSCSIFSDGVRKTMDSMMGHTDETTTAEGEKKPEEEVAQGGDTMEKDIDTGAGDVTEEQHEMDA